MRARRWPQRLKRAATGFAILLLSLVGIIYALWPNPKRGEVGGPAEPPYLTVFMVDGLDRRTFEAELQTGRLPHVAQLIEQGIYVERGVASFPSMSGYGFYPFHTGHDAALSGIFGLRWFNRQLTSGSFRQYVGKTNRLMNLDLTPEPKTVFEVFGDEHSFSINSYNNRGVRVDYKTGWAFTMAKYKDHWWLAGLLSHLPLIRDAVAPDWPEVESQVMDLAIDDLKNRPKVQWITLVSPDTYSHVYGLGPRYPELLRHLDALVGRYRAAARARGMDKDRIYVFATDHGVSEVNKNADLVQTFARHGVRAFRGEATKLLSGGLDESMASLNFEVLIAINGNLVNLLYVRKPNAPAAQAWKTAPTRTELMAYPNVRGESVPLVDILLSDPSIEHVILRGAAPGSIEVVSSGGRGLIEEREGNYRYTVTGADPFGYKGTISLVDDAFHPKKRWLRATAKTAFPDAIHRCAVAMQQSGAPDLIVTSKKGWDLANDYELFVSDYQGGHGGLRSDQISVPYVLAGPGIGGPRRIETARAEDVGATVLEALGVPLEGRSGQIIRFPNGTRGDQAGMESSLLLEGTSTTVHQGERRPAEHPSSAGANSP